MANKEFIKTLCRVNGFIDIVSKASTDQARQFVFGANWLEVYVSSSEKVSCCFRVQTHDHYRLYSFAYRLLFDNSIFCVLTRLFSPSTIFNIDMI